MTDELRHAPVQTRSLTRVQAIRDAALAVINEKGRDRFTTNDVAVAANCSIGTVYRYFPDRVAILDDLFPGRDNAEQSLVVIRDYLRACATSGFDADMAELWKIVGDPEGE